MSDTVTPHWEEWFAEVASSLPEIDRKLAARLPVVPNCIREFSELTRDSSAPITRLADVIASDGTLSAMLMRHVNSAMYGATRKVSTINQAIMLVGLRKLKNLVLSLSLQQALGSVKSQQMSMLRFRQETRERSIFARQLAVVLQVDSETVHTASLLQDILLPVVTELWPDDYGKNRDYGVGLSHFERQTFGWDHAALAASMMRDWSFPPEIILCVLMHHFTDAEQTDGLSGCGELSAVMAASLLPDQLNQTHGPAQRLLKFQKEHPLVSMLEVAEDADNILQADQTPGESTTLCHRLSQLLTATLVEDQFRSMLVERTIGRYTLEAEIGNGSMGIVFKARHEMLRRPAAVKILDTRRLNDESIRRFEAEVQLTAQLTSPYTITIFDYGVTPEGFFYYVMEFVHGITLQELVRQNGPLLERDVIQLLLQACESLAEAHAANLIHRDVKPDNMMVRVGGIAGDTLKLLDFGMAAVTHGTDVDRWGPQECGGTPLYLAPETILTPREVDARVDIYALGAVAYFLLTGLPLYELDDDDLTTLLQYQVEKIPVRPRVRAKVCISAEFERVIMKCLEKDRDDRPESVTALALLLRNCLKSHSSVNTPLDLQAKVVATARHTSPKLDSAATLATRIMPAGRSNSGFAEFERKST
jgi:eukaryotic-like serine/threonine-protein kinase